MDDIPHFATVSYAFCKRFPDELTTEIFEHILNKALNNRMVDPSTIFIDGTHIKASANKKKYQAGKPKLEQLHFFANIANFSPGYAETPVLLNENLGSLTS